MYSNKKTPYTKVEVTRKTDLWGQGTMLVVQESLQQDSLRAGEGK